MREREKWSEEEETEDVRDGKKGEGRENMEGKRRKEEGGEQSVKGRKMNNI